MITIWLSSSNLTSAKLRINLICGNVWHLMKQYKTCNNQFPLVLIGVNTLSFHNIHENIYSLLHNLEDWCRQKRKHSLPHLHNHDWKRFQSRPKPRYPLPFKTGPYKELLTLQIYAQISFLLFINFRLPKNEICIVTCN